MKNNVLEGYHICLNWLAAVEHGKIKRVLQIAVFSKVGADKRTGNMVKHDTLEWFHGDKWFYGALNETIAKTCKHIQSEKNTHWGAPTGGGKSWP